MKEQKEPRAVIMQSWMELIEEIVPDEKEQCGVFKYIFAEYMRIGYGVPHERKKPDGAGGIVAKCILPQVERMCSKYAEIEQKRRQNLTKANAAKELKTTRRTEEDYNESFD